LLGKCELGVFANDVNIRDEQGCMLSVNNISKAYNEHAILSAVSFRLQAGKVYGLIGPSGGGKSTLLKVLGGVEEPSGGEISWERGEPQQCEHAQSDWSSASSIGLMFQEGALFDSLTVLDNVAFPLVGGRVPLANLRKLERDRTADKVMAVLKDVGLARAALKYPSQLSGGMRRRASLARALVSNPRVMLLDDPTSGLDPVASSVIMDLVTSVHRGLGSLTLIASHDLRRLLPAVDEVLCLFDGRIRFIGSVADLKSGNDEVVRNFARCRYDLDG
jgi:phospholipid/cholesterol/gamma-HCH transport system ATP-binding protein